MWRNVLLILLSGVIWPGRELFAPRVQSKKVAKQNGEPTQVIKKTVPSMFKIAKISIAILFLVAIFNSEISAQDEFGPDTIWKPPDLFENQYYDCIGTGDVSCLLPLMTKAGASSSAISFAKKLDGEAHLSDFLEMGRVDLGYAFYTVRANSNGQVVMLNGSPEIVKAEEIGDLGITNDPLYPSLYGRYPDLMLWPSD